MAYAGIWCGEQPERELIALKNGTDNHTPWRFRLLGVSSQSSKFSEDWGCPANSPMNPADRCDLWWNIILVSLNGWKTQYPIWHVLFLLSEGQLNLSEQGGKDTIFQGFIRQLQGILKKNFMTCKIIQKSLFGHPFPLAHDVFYYPIRDFNGIDSTTGIVNNSTHHSNDSIRWHTNNSTCHRNNSTQGYGDTLITASAPIPILW